MAPGASGELTAEAQVGLVPFSGEERRRGCGVVFSSPWADSFSPTERRPDGAGIFLIRSNTWQHPHPPQDQTPSDAEIPNGRL